MKRKSFFQIIMVIIWIVLFIGQQAWSQAPANDNFADASVITGLSGQCTASNVNATSESGEPDHSPYNFYYDDEHDRKSLWYSWTAPRTDFFTFNTRGSSFDTLLAVYTGSSLDSLSEVIKNNDVEKIPEHSSVTFQAQKNTRYFIAVDGFRYKSGNIVLNWKLADRPENDDFSNSYVITGTSGNVSGSTIEATEEQNEPEHAGKPGGKSLWYSWTAPEDNYFFFQLGGFPDLLAVYTGSSLDTLTEVASNGMDSRLTFMAQAGIQYFIAVDGSDRNIGGFVLYWKIAVRPENDDFSDALMLSGISGQASFANVQATKEAGEPDHAGNKGGKSVWYLWTAPQNGFFLFDTDSSVRTLAVYTGAAVDNLSEVTSNYDGVGDDYGSLQSFLTFQAQAGVQYYIAVDGYDGDGGYGTLTWESVPPYPGDDIEDAFGLTGPAGKAAGGSNTDATKESYEPNHAGNKGGKSVWYVWRAPTDGYFTFDTHGSSFDTLLAVYTISGIDIEVKALTEVAANDDDGSPGNTGSLSFQAQAEMRYYIAVDGSFPYSGDIVLNWEPASANDSFAKASVLTSASGQAIGSNANAAKEPGEPDHAGNIGGKSLWFTWTAPKSDVFTFDTRGSSFDTLLAVYTGQNIGSLTEIASNDDKSGDDNSSSLTFQATAGVQYYIAADGKDAQAGELVLNWVCSADRRIYKFERMWPTLQQPWYFAPAGLSADSNGFIYIADTLTNRAYKFTSDGQLVVKWGRRGAGDGEFYMPQGITADTKGFIYVADTYNHCIQKFTPGGQFIAKWGGLGGSQDGQFAGPKGIASDTGNFIYVLDSGNNRIQKFTSDGQFVSKWKTCDTGEERFSLTHGIAIDSNGVIYVTDSGKNRIRKFTSDGEFIGQLELTSGKGPGEFKSLAQIAVDNKGFLYIADYQNSRIQKLTLNGEYITQWGSCAGGDGKFCEAYGVAVDSNGFVYATDAKNYAIQKFSSEGQLLTKWRSWGDGDGEFYKPSAIMTDSQGFVYVDDTGNNRIQQFASDGQFVAKWTRETGEDVFSTHSYDSVADSEGFIYTTDAENHCVRKLTPEGLPLAKWGEKGSGDREFNEPAGITVDSNGFVYVADTGNNRVQILTTDGQFVTKFGEFGSNPGQLNSPFALAVNKDGRIYVSDFGNHRVQVFRPGLPTDKKMKAVIVAGSKSPADSLWDATQTCANFAYRAMTYQGFTKESIFYLTPDTDLDLDDNGEADDVDGDAVKANLEKALTEWAADADRLVVYLTDHGLRESFRMNSKEQLSVSELDSWLDTLQTNTSCEVIVVYDACLSGSFVDSLTPPANRKRIVIASTNSEEPAVFMKPAGTISFSAYFWASVFNGADIRDSYDFAKNALGAPKELQHPMIDANSNGTGNEAEDFDLVRNVYIGNGVRIQAESPQYADASVDQTLNGTNEALLYVSGITDEDGIARVWAVIRPPDYAQNTSGLPLIGIPTLELLPVEDAAGRYENVYDGFDIEGTYQVAIYAKDGAGNTMLPILRTVTSVNPLKRRAVILAGETQDAVFRTAIEQNAGLAYQALKFQGYANGTDHTTDAVYFMSPSSFSEGVDGLPSWSSLKYAVETWAGKDTLDLVLYLIGEEREGKFQINNTESLSAADLDNWLDNLQATLPGKVTVIYDACNGADFIKSLTAPPGKERILIASTASNQPAAFLSGGEISFSAFFWKQVINGMNVWDAFLYAYCHIEYLIGQTPVLDDNGDGIGPDYHDGKFAQNYTIGAGIMLAGSDPLIDSISPPQTLTGETSALIWADNVSALGAAGKVSAVIMPPGYAASSSSPVTALPILTLTQTAAGRYEAVFNDFSAAGTYQILVYAQDSDGSLSAPGITQVVQTVASERSESLQITVSLDGAANLAVYNPENNVCNKGECEIPNADFQIGGNAEQIVSFSVTEQGDWRFMLYGRETSVSYLSVTSPPDTEISREIRIEAHQVLKCAVVVGSDLSFSVEEAKIPTASDGRPLFYDFDGDGDIDDADIERVASKWNTAEGDPEYDSFYDLDDDGTITVLDIMRVAPGKSEP